ncbi:MAG: hypothetical protein O3A01_03640 [bacterium]|nr:hypothetical protein [bacterium]
MSYFTVLFGLILGDVYISFSFGGTPVTVTEFGEMEINGETYVAARLQSPVSEFEPSEENPSVNIIVSKEMMIMRHFYNEGEEILTTISTDPF